jgi:TfoX/Sxy family transcriptional regulator of competence genes
MPNSPEFVDYVLEQIPNSDQYEQKKQFGGTVLMHGDKAFLKIKNDQVWLKTDDQTSAEFTKLGMAQYRYGKDRSRHLNFHEIPPEIVEDSEKLGAWVETAKCVAAK